ncbi:helix-turn-helix domain-containing protein [Umezawaea tangerina]|uniref:Helix-turn-helix protein n=1 Tax=Umezawaea tangerina TaxID=84725 RepID=A0A2T0TCC2_9PSEU|nr:helix-turn-helix transcriptional regulator [Umezawaea tangerina]PRY43310.1 helix-turn-helix protein [Umezawaea tangerina]
MVEEQSPSSYKGQLGMELKRLREAAGLDFEDAARVLGCSVSKIRTIERGQVSVRPTELRPLLDEYRVGPAERADLEHLAEQSRRRRPRTPWGSAVPDRLRRFFNAEETAAVIRAYQPNLLHGLVQTEGYARAVIETNSSVPRGDVDRLVQARLARQARLTSERPPELHLVVDEHVLRAPVGGAKVMREQLRHLAALARRGEVRVRVIPTGVGVHPGTSSPSFMVLSPPSRPNIVYVETLTDGLFVDEQERLARYETVMVEMQALALSEADSLLLVDTVAAAL